MITEGGSASRYKAETKKKEFELKVEQLKERRDERRWDEFHFDDFRTPAQHDHDRVQHCNALRRLAGVTQVVNPHEGQIYHNRLTHTLKVAQIARRIAERLQNERITDQNHLLKLGWIDPDAVETGALIHDLGHPPFAHTGEAILDKLVRQYNLDGFQGNAQSFRIVTKLATRRMHSEPIQENDALQSDGGKQTVTDETVPADQGSFLTTRVQPGLNLTYGTLRAALKYPWTCQEGWERKYPGIPFDKNTSQDTVFKKRPRLKWGAYTTELDELNEIRALGNGPEHQHKSLEAAIIELADDITYGTHDVEDFYRAGFIPLHSFYPGDIRRSLNGVETPHLNAIFTSDAEYFIRHVCEAKENVSEELIRHVFNAMTYQFIAITGPYRGLDDQKAKLRNLFDNLIDGYVHGVRVNEKAIENPLLEKLTFLEEDNAEYMSFIDQVDKYKGQLKPSYYQTEIDIIQELTHCYVHENQGLQMQERGEKHIVTELFKIYFDAYLSGEEGDNATLLPSDAFVVQAEMLEEDREALTQIAVKSVEEALAARMAADYICRMTDEEATRLYQRLMGYDLGYLHDSIP